MTEHPAERGGQGSMPHEHLAPVTYLHGAGFTPEAPRRVAAPRAPAGEHTPAGEPAENDVAAHLALRQLAGRDMSRWELRESLQRHGVDEEVAQAQVAGLIRQGLLDDRALATTLIETRFARKGLSRAGMRRELQRRHVSDGDIAAALAGIPEEQDRDRALRLARARVAHRDTADTAAIRRRLSSYLSRRGYPASVVMSVVQEVLGDADEESGE